MEEVAGQGPQEETSKEALFIAWLKRNSAGKSLRVCRRKLAHFGLSEDIFDSFPDGVICIQRQFGEEFVRLEDRGWADRYASLHEVKVLHHTQRVKMKKYFP